MAFLTTLNVSLTKYLEVNKDPTLSGYIEWVKSNPPVEGGPREGTVTRQVWDFLDLHPGMVRSQVIQTLVGQGLNAYTVLTQMNRYFATQTRKGEKK